MSELKAKAAEQVKMYPQYNNYFDDWIEVVVNKKIKTKLGIVFTAGERVLMRPEVRHSENGTTWVTAWSMLTKCAVSIPLNNVLINFKGLMLSHANNY